MPQKLTVKLTGDLDVKQDSATCPGGTRDPGQGFKFELRSANQQADTEISQRIAVIDATGGPVALPFPANLEGRVLYLRTLDGATFDVEVTHATQGATVYPVRGVLVLEPADDEAITAVRVLSGQGSIEWVVTGSEV